MAYEYGEEIAISDVAFRAWEKTLEGFLWWPDRRP
jgi:hypothetical protein